jgi:hypothetical protein
VSEAEPLAANNKPGASRFIRPRQVSGLASPNFALEMSFYGHEVSGAVGPVIRFGDPDWLATHIAALALRNLARFTGSQMITSAAFPTVFPYVIDSEITVSAGFLAKTRRT